MATSVWGTRHSLFGEATQRLSQSTAGVTASVVHTMVTGPLSDLATKVSRIATLRSDDAAYSAAEKFLENCKTGVREAVQFQSNTISTGVQAEGNEEKVNTPHI